MRDHTTWFGHAEDLGRGARPLLSLGQPEALEGRVELGVDAGGGGAADDVGAGECVLQLGCSSQVGGDLGVRGGRLGDGVGRGREDLGLSLIHI